MNSLRNRIHHGGGVMVALLNCTSVRKQKDNDGNNNDHHHALCTCGKVFLETMTVQSSFCRLNMKIKQVQRG